MNKRQLAVIERAVESGQEIFPLNTTWRTVHDEYNIGTIQANKLKLTQADKHELIRLAQSTTGLDLSRHSIRDLKSLHREEALAFVNDEKMAGKQVKGNRLAIKALPGNSLKLNDQAYRLPDAGYFDIALEDLVSCQHHCILIIENYRCFDQTQKLRFSLDEPFRDPLVIFRGDPVYSENTVRQVLNNLNLPVLAMTDIDPKGLSIAQSWPNLCGLIAPSFAVLEMLLADIDHVNPSLYTKQYAGSRRKLADSMHPLIIKLWTLLMDKQVGVVQEHWLTGKIELTLLKMDI